MDGRKILIVDDDQDIRQLLGHRLKAQGFEAVFAGDAISAVNQARKEQPDLILLDLSLPAGDGYIVMDRLKAMPALEGIPVIVVSARDPQTEEERLAQSGADAFFRKPFDYDQLLTAISRALGLRPAE
ncbi:MAG TPA: response regulator [Gaiellaceae bacterium]|jgi:CheY-like chemotaxis protein|nr:response regulator [Gaiellaceae bacterium]